MSDDINRRWELVEPENPANPNSPLFCCKDCGRYEDARERALHHTQKEFRRIHARQCPGRNRAVPLPPSPFTIDVSDQVELL